MIPPAVSIVALRCVLIAFVRSAKMERRSTMLCSECGHFVGSKDMQRVQEETFRFISEQYSTLEVIRLLGIGHESLGIVMMQFEREESDKLKELLASKIVDREESQPFDLGVAIEYLDMPYKSSSSFKRLLNNRSIPVADIQQLIAFINQNYRPKNLD